MALLDMQGIPHCHDVAGQHVKTVGAFRRITATMPTQIRPQHGEALRQRFGLCIPDRVVRPQRMQQRHAGAVTLFADMQSQSVELQIHASDSLPFDEAGTFAGAKCQRAAALRV